MGEELEAGAAPAESIEAAPVEAATADVAPAEAAEPSPVEVAESVDPSLPAEEDAVEAAPVSYPSPEDFGWDEWEGDTDGLPEELRPWGQKFGDYYNQRMLTAQQQMAKTKEVYDAILNGNSDPRLKHLESSVGEWENKYTGLTGQYEYLQRQFTQYQSEVTQALEAEADAYAEEFAESNPDLFNNEELSTVFADLLEDNWILEHAAVAARLPKHLREIAKQAKVDGVPDSYALKLAQGAKSRPAKPRPGAALTAGATTPARSSEQVSLPDNKPMSLQEFRKQVARNALSNKRR